MTERTNEDSYKVWDPEMRERVAQDIEAIVDQYGGIEEPVRMGIAYRRMATDIPTKHVRDGQPLLARVYVDRDIRSEYVPKAATRMQRVVNAVLARSWVEKVSEVTKPNAIGIDFYTGHLGYREQGFHPMLHWSITYGPKGDRIVESIGRALRNIALPSPASENDS